MRVLPLVLMHVRAMVAPAAVPSQLLAAFMLGRHTGSSPFDSVRRAHGVTRADVRRGRTMVRTPPLPASSKPPPRSRSLSRT